MDRPGGEARRKVTRKKQGATKNTKHVVKSEAEGRNLVQNRTKHLPKCGPGVLWGPFESWTCKRRKTMLRRRFGAPRGSQDGEKHDPTTIPKNIEKRRQKTVFGSIFVHFGKSFGRLFGSKIDPGAPSERFLGEKRHSEYTLLFVVI